MSILQEIIQEATSVQCDVTRMLRLCLVLAARLKHEPLKVWVRNELEGYGPDELLPEYRIFSVINRGYFMGTNYNGTLDISLEVLPEKLRPSFAIAELTSGIAEYIDLANKSGNGGNLKMPWPVELALEFGSKYVSYGQCIKAWKQISPSDIVAMADQIKTRVLGFALDIEGESPNAGDIAGVSSNVASEKITQFFTTNIYGQIGIMQTGGNATTNVIQGD